MYSSVDQTSLRKKFPLNPSLFLLPPSLLFIPGPQTTLVQFLLQSKKRCREELVSSSPSESAVLRQPQLSPSSWSSSSESEKERWEETLTEKVNDIATNELRVFFSIIQNLETNNMEWPSEFTMYPGSESISIGHIFLRYFQIIQEKSQTYTSRHNSKTSQKTTGNLSVESRFQGGVRHLLETFHDCFFPFSLDSSSSLPVLAPLNTKEVFQHQEEILNSLLQQKLEVMNSNIRIKNFLVSVLRQTPLRDYGRFFSLLHVVFPDAEFSPTLLQQEPDLSDPSILPQILQLHDQRSQWKDFSPLQQSTLICVFTFPLSRLARILVQRDRDLRQKRNQKCNEK